METIRLHRVIEKDGELSITGLPFNKGAELEITVQQANPTARQPLTARRLLESGLVGLWKDRTDIDDSAAFARRLREQAQNRQTER